MRPFIKNTPFLFSLIVILVTTGCATTQTKTVTTQRTIQDTKTTLQSADQAALPSTADLKPPVIQTGRYSSIQAAPTPSQRKLLHVVISISFPEEIKTIHQALEYLLKRSGYQLVQPQASQIELIGFLRNPLPNVHRHIGPMTLEDALSMLTAPAFTLKQDPVSRLISYTLNERYARGI